MIWEEGSKKREESCKGPEARATLGVFIEQKEKTMHHSERAGGDENGDGDFQKPLWALARSWGFILN